MKFVFLIFSQDAWVCVYTIFGEEEKEVML